jgi:ubiquinol-cytochrome c reductase iron-sulfur subunit
MTSGNITPGDITTDDTSADGPRSGARAVDPHGSPEQRVASGTDLPASQQSGSELEQRFPDPGLPAHVHRRSDTDPVAAKRAERQVAGLFALSTLGTLVFVVGFLAIKLEDGINDATWSTLVLVSGSRSRSSASARRRSTGPRR